MAADAASSRVHPGNYWGGRDAPPDRAKPPVAVAKDRLLDGLAVSRDLVGPSMRWRYPTPRLLADPADYSAVAVAQLEQAGTLRDRIAILDLHRATDPATFSLKGLCNPARRVLRPTSRRRSLNLAFGTAYAPALHTTLLAADDIDYTDLQGSPETTATLKALLLANCDDAQAIAKIGQAFPAAPPAPPLTPQQVQALNQDLVAALPLLQQIEAILLAKLNVAPPSGIIAGIWTANDAAHGVWKAPANVACAAVTAPVVRLADTDQGAYNTPLNGIAIDLIRAFPNMGVLVWGARTLAGNSDDWRYVPVRRTGVFIEQRRSWPGPRAVRVRTEQCRHLGCRDCDGQQLPVRLLETGRSRRCQAVRRLQRDVRHGSDDDGERSPERRHERRRPDIAAASGGIHRSGNPAEDVYVLIARISSTARRAWSIAPSV